MNTKVYKQFPELSGDTLENITGGDDFTRGMYKLGRAVRDTVNKTGKFICDRAPWC
ncbi:hypothetical protein [Streptococcus thoraltensis]|uniref:hypothetical protein n=1 Tax=Streptococcus thoraltensis TaxID=55085 RepID=UPI00035DAC89|nr:hypothetical protein [Streptococcus thoraltensis]